jgi:hypothetical protein
MAEQAARFGVVATDRRQSSVWRAWVSPRRSDVYIAVRSIAGKFKASLHESGVWRAGFTTQFSSKPGGFVLPPGDRAQEKWRRPEEFAPGLTMAFQIVVPESELWLPASIVNPPDTHWEHAPAAGSQTVFSVVLMRGDQLDASTWPGKEDVANRLVAPFNLENKETCLIVAHDQLTHPQNRSTIDAFKRQVDIARKAMSQPVNWSSFRAIILAVDDRTGTRKAIEVRLSD